MKWALIGYGGMGHWHVNNVKSLSADISIAGIYDILEEKRIQAENDGLHAYPTLEALLADPEIDFVTIATPNDFHRPIAIQAMAAGKHVISEKPVTLSSGDLQAMIDASRQYGRLFSVHQNRRWDRDYLIIKKLFEENALGRIFNIESRVHQLQGIPEGWRNRKLPGGGMVLDWGVHMLDQLLQLVPEDIVSVYNVNSYITSDEVDDGFKAIITFASGITAQVEMSTSSFINLPRWFVQGENGTAVINDWDCTGEIVKVSDWENREAVPVVSTPGVTKVMAPRREEYIEHYPLPEVEGDWQDYYRNFIKAINGEETQIVTHKQMMRVVRLMEALLKSAEMNEVVHSRI